MTGRGTAAGPGLVVEGLGVALPGRQGPQTVLERVDLSVPPGQVVVLLGPSGAGKSTLVSALLGLLPPGALVRGRACWTPAPGPTGRAPSGNQTGEAARQPLEAGARQPIAAGARRAVGSDPAVDLLDPGPAGRERQRGRLTAWLPQGPTSSMTPVLTVGHHLLEKARVHARGGRAQALLDVALPRHRVDPAWWGRLPSQLSGGQAQRVSNALALLGDPGLVLADEPTTGLDRALARHVGTLLVTEAHEEGRAVLVVTHDLALAVEIADAVVVLEAGVTAERLSPLRLRQRLRETGHHDVRHGEEMRNREPAGQDVRGLVGTGLTLVRGAGHVVRRDVDVEVRPDRTTGLMAPSGAGKTTLLRTLALLHPPAAGRLLVDGRPPGGTRHGVPAEVRRRVGYVPQDPWQAVDPRWTLGRTLLEPMRIGRRRDGRNQHGSRGGAEGARDDELVAELLASVGLPPEIADRRPSQVSGGQLQRVVVARALAMDPDYLLLDEPTSMVDVATAESVMAAVHAHQHRTGCGVLVASHDELLLRRWCDVVVRWEVPEQG